MGALLSCLHRADDSSLPLSFPNRKSSQLLTPKKAKSSIIEDDKTPIWNGEEGSEFLPCALTNLSFSLDEIKTIKSKLGV
ncbi:O-acyltransferase WSD1-like, partial [Trifolium medium]